MSIHIFTCVLRCGCAAGRLLAFLLTGTFFLSAPGSQAQPGQSKLPVWYPFVRDGKWGYIDAKGEWVIQPRFGRCIHLFEGDRVQVWQDKQGRYIDRTGNWIAEPPSPEGLVGARDEPGEILHRGKKQGISTFSGKVILPPKYDEVALSRDRAWVRQGEKLGVFSLEGHWILEPSTFWPKGRDMPVPTDGEAAWFKQDRKWGLLSAEGKRLFPARFAEHIMGRRDSAESTHPEGLDFNKNRAWVTDGKDYLLITTDGRILARQPFRFVQEWTDGFYLFHTAARYSEKDRMGVISREGEIVLPAQYCEIKPPHEGRAVVARSEEQRGPGGEVESVQAYGYIDERGRILLEPGTYNGPGVRDGGQMELAPYSEGLTPVWNYGQDHAFARRYEHFAGYIDANGTLVIAEQFRATQPFSDGLGAVEVRGSQSPGAGPAPGDWGYVNRSGAMMIAPRFTQVTPFCRDRAWVSRDIVWNQAKWAMIDRSGNVLTDFSFVPPEEMDGSRFREGENLAFRAV